MRHAIAGRRARPTLRRPSDVHGGRHRQARRDLATPLAPVVLSGTALFVALLAAQGLLGASQGPVFPMVAAAFETWFPQRQWAVTQGLNTLCMNVGGAMTPLVIVALTVHFGWQGALMWIALPAVVITAAWAWYGRDTPRAHPGVTVAELAELDTDEAAEPRPVERSTV